MSQKKILSVFLYFPKYGTLQIKVITLIYNHKLIFIIVFFFFIIRTRFEIIDIGGGNNKGSEICGDSEIQIKNLY